MLSNNKNISIAIIKANWHEALTNQLNKDCLETLKNYGINKDINVNIMEYTVPGSVELPLIAKIIATEKKVDAIICIGVVIKGESDHYTHVANQVSYGCQKVALSTNIPVIFAVLTCANLSLAKARVNGDHSKVGVESAEAALKMVEVIRSIKNN